MFSGSSEGISILLLAWAQTLGVILDQNFLPHYSHLFHQQILLTLLHSKSKLWLLLTMSAITPKSSTIFFPPELTFLLSLIPPSPSVFNHSHSKLKKKKESDDVTLLFKNLRLPISHRAEMPISSPWPVRHYNLASWCFLDLMAYSFILATLATQNSRQAPHLKAFSFAFFLLRNFFLHLWLSSCNSLYANVTLWRPSLITVKMQNSCISKTFLPFPFILLLSTYYCFTCHIFTNLLLILSSVGI